eukprot:2450614-Rhodomonas_salina.2
MSLPAPMYAGGVTVGGAPACIALASGPAPKCGERQQRRGKWSFPLHSEVGCLSSNFRWSPRNNPVQAAGWTIVALPFQLRHCRSVFKLGPWNTDKT